MSLVNVDPLNPNDGSPDPIRLMQYGIRGVRLVVRTDERVRQYKAAVQASGLLVLGVVTEESGGEVYADDPCDITQIGNEPDRGTNTQPYKPGSDIMGAAAYVEYWRLYWNEWFAPGRPLDGHAAIGAGLQSGRTSYWSAVVKAGGLPGSAAMALHPYAKDAAAAASLIKAYRALSPWSSVWITEWNRSLAEIPAYKAMLHQAPGVVGDAWFCFHDYNGFALTDAGARVLGACP